MKINHLKRIGLVGLFLLIWISGMSAIAIADDVVVIANKNVPVNSISASMLKEIFLGNKTTWGNGSKINFAVLEYGEAHNAFLKTYVQKSASQYNNHWKRLMFTGKGQMPTAFGADSAMVDYVAGTPGAIGYVSGSADTGSVKVITAN